MLNDKVVSDEWRDKKVRKIDCGGFRQMRRAKDKLLAIHYIIP